MPVDHSADEVTESQDSALAGSPVVVRRNAGLSALVGAGASAVAIAYLWRTTQTGLVLDWALCAVMGFIAVLHLAALVDSRTPLLVADDLGVRIRLGDEWRGLPWEAIDRVTVHPRLGLLRDGRITVTPHSLARALDGLDAKGRRHASLNRRMYGATLAVPVGITTRVSSDGERTLADEITALSRGRADVVEVPEAPTEQPAEGETPVAAPGEDPGERTAPGEAEDHTEIQAEEEAAGELPEAPEAAVENEEPTPGPGAGRRFFGGIGTIVSRAAKGASQDEQTAGSRSRSDAHADEDAAPGRSAPVLSAEAIPLRATRAGLRAEVTREVPATLASAEPAADPGPGAVTEGRELHQPGRVDLVFEPAGTGRVRPISQLGDPVEPLVIDDFVTEPAYDPVIGPDLAAARTRLGLSVDELADRTRIRPHVIESIEVDDFAPCGGDFYARGHLRTLARVLGKDATPLLARFEERYATAPVNARRVFEAELATGMTGSMRSTMGGPNWGLLVGVVVVLALVWGAVRLFASEPAHLVQNPQVLGGSVVAREPKPTTAAPAPAQVSEPLMVTLAAAHGSTRVMVRDGNGRLVYSGLMALGQKKHVRAVPPIRVHAADAGAIEVRVAGQDRGVLGLPGHPGLRTFR